MLCLFSKKKEISVKKVGHLGEVHALLSSVQLSQGQEGYPMEEGHVFLNINFILCLPRPPMILVTQ